MIIHSRYSPTQLDLVNIHADINIPLDGATIHILDSSGRLIFSEQLRSTRQQIDTSTLITGFYLVEITSENQKIALNKLIIQ